MKKPNKERGNFPLRMPEDLRKRLQEVADKHETTMTAVILAGIRRQVERLERSETVI